MQSQDTTTAAKTATIAKVLTLTHEGQSFSIGLTEKGTPSRVGFGQDWKRFADCTREEADFLRRASESNPENEPLDTASVFASYALLSPKDKKAIRAAMDLCLYRVQLAEGKPRPGLSYISPQEARGLQDRLRAFVETLPNPEEAPGVLQLLALPTE